MMNFTNLPSVPSDHPVPFTDQLRLAEAAYLARFKGASRYHTESDLRCYLSWCAEHGPDPLAARRPHLELYIRWTQEIRRFQPSTVSRRFSVVRVVKWFGPTCRREFWPRCRAGGLRVGLAAGGGAGRRWFLRRGRRVAGRPFAGRTGCSTAGCGRVRGAGGAVAGRIGRIGGVAYRHAPVAWLRAGRQAWLAVLLVASR
jgi:hypothetical protein